MMSADVVADRAQKYSAAGYEWGTGMCLRFSRMCAGAPGGTHNAYLAWTLTKRRHTNGTPPRGALVFWSGGAKGYGHVAVSDGGGYVWSTDIARAGKVDRVSIAKLGASWPNLRYVGWSEDINGTIITGFPAPLPVIRINTADVRVGERNRSVKALQVELRRRGFAALNPSGATGFYGRETLAMVRAFQRTYAGNAADGLAGPKTLAHLGLLS